MLFIFQFFFHKSHLTLIQLKVMGCIIMFNDVPPLTSRSSHSCKHRGRSVFYLQTELYRHPSHLCTSLLHPIFLCECVRVKGYAFRRCTLDVTSTHHPHPPHPSTGCSPSLFPKPVTLLRPQRYQPVRGEGWRHGRMDLQKPPRRRRRL